MRKEGEEGEILDSAALVLIVEEDLTVGIAKNKGGLHVMNKICFRGYEWIHGFLENDVEESKSG